MTLAAITPRILWAGSGSTSTLSLSVEGGALTFNTNAEIVVRQKITATGEESTLTLGVDYSISGGPVLSSGASPATLTRIAGNLPSGTTWSVLRVSPSSQTLDVPQGGDFSSGDIEAALDRITAQVQEIREQVARGFRISEFNASGTSPQLPAAQALNFLRWNAAANALENAAIVDTSGSVVSSFMETLLDDANSAEARGTLGALAASGVSSFAATVLDDTSAAAMRTTLAVPRLDGPNVFTPGASNLDFEWLRLQPTDAGAGKPYIYIRKSNVAADYEIGIWDGSSNAGTLSLSATGLLHSGNAVLTAADYADTNFVGGVVAVIQDQKAQNVDGGASSTSDVARTLNVLTFNKNSAVSLAGGTTGVGGTANQFVLPAGTWRIDWRAPSYNSGAHRSIIHNVTDNVTVGIGSSGFSDQNASSDPSQSDSVGTCVVTIAAAKTFELRHSTASAYAGGDGWGFGVNKGTEVYSQVVISAA